jgi:uncharacterized protein YukE
MAHSRQWILRRRSRRLKRNQRFGDKAAFHGINWDWYPHEQLYEFAMSADTAAMRRQAGDWTELGGAIGDTTNQVRTIMQGLLQSWQGESAAQASASNENLTQWAQNASETATHIGAGLHKYTDAAEFAKANMPPPDSTEHVKGYLADGATQPNSAVMIMSLLDDQKAADDRKRAGKAEAVRVMKEYSSESQDVHNTMPWFYDAPAQSPPAPIGDPPSRDDGSDDHELRDPRPGQDPSPGTPWRDPADIGTTPSGFSPAGAVPGDGGGGAGSGGQTGYGAGAGFPGSAGGADSVRGGGSPGIGSGPLAARGPAAAAGGGAAGLPGGGRGAIGAGGAGGFGAPLGAGAGAQREEDAEHKTKFVEGLDLFDDLPPAYPPVFGA